MLPKWSLGASTVFFLASALLICAAAANAETQSPLAQPAPNSSERHTNIPDQKLDATAAAMQRVDDLKRDYQQRIEAAEASDRKRIADEAHDALIKAVTDQGLSVEEYTSIVMLAQGDATVRDKLVQRLHPSAK